MAATEEVGQVFVYAESADGNARQLMFTERTEILNQTTPSEKWIVPFSNVSVQGGSKLVFEFLSDATDGIDLSDSTVNLPIVLTNQATGAKGSKILTTDDLTGTDGTVATAAVKQRLWTYTVPDGLLLSLDGGRRGRIAVYDDTA